MTTIKITELTDIGANLTSTTVLPVVNMTGTPTTQKTVLGNIANAILSEAGGDYVSAGVALLAGTVTTAAQPNVTSVGTLTGLTSNGVVNFANTSNVTLGAVGNVHISGGTSGYVLQTDGSGTLSWVAQSGGSSYGNSDVANYLPTFTGNVGAGNVVATGNLFSAGLLSNGVANVNSNVASTNQNTGALKVRGGLGVVGNVHSGGEIHSGGNTVVGGQSLFVGPDADATGLTNPTIIAFHGGETYIQAALKNSLSTGSADWVAYGDNGTDSQGWADFGFTSSGFNDANYTITGSGDGYFFVETFAGSYGGNLVLATGSEGTVRDIIFATGGFLANAEIARISDANNSLELTRANATITFSDGTIQSTAYTGGSNPFNQDLNTTDNVQFANITSTDAIRFVNSGNVVGALGYAPTYLSIEGYQSNSVNITANDIYTWSFDNNGVLSKSDANGLVLAANFSAQIITDFGDNNRTWTFDGTSGELVLPGGNVLIDPTDNNFEVRGAQNINFEANAVVNIYTDTSNNGWQWQFGDDGNLILAGGNSIVRSVANSSLDPLNPNVSTMVLTPDAGYSSQSLVLDPTAPGHIHLRAPGANIDEPYANIFLGGETSSFEVGYYNGSAPNVFIHSGNNTWTFDNTGVLTVPGEGIINSINDVVTLRSSNTLSGNSNGVYLGTSGGFGFFDTAIVGNWLEIFRNGSDPQIGTPGNLKILTDSTNTAQSWTFDTAGNLTLPGNTFSVNYANGTQVSLGGNYGDSNVVTLLDSFGSNSISTTGNITGNTNGYTIGYRDIPQVAASNTTLGATDGGKHYYSTTAGNLTLTIPNNATTSFATGTAISIVVQAAGNILVNAAAGVTLYIAGNSTAANRVVGAYGMATLMKVASDTWFINGTGVS